MTKTGLVPKEDQVILVIEKSGDLKIIFENKVYATLYPPFEITDILKAIKTGYLISWRLGDLTNPSFVIKNRNRPHDHYGIVEEYAKLVEKKINVL